MSSKTSKLTLDDLLAAETGGFGYLGHAIRQPDRWEGKPDPEAHVRKLDQMVVDMHNALGLSKEQLHAFVDSRAGRHYGDMIYGEANQDEILRSLEKSILLNLSEDEKGKIDPNKLITNKPRVYTDAVTLNERIKTLRRFKKGRFIAVANPNGEGWIIVSIPSEEL